MEIVRDNINDMDCLMMQHMAQARGSKKKWETVKYTEGWRNKRKELQAKNEEDGTQQRDIESWQEQDGSASIGGCWHTEGAHNTAVLKWSDVFGSSSPEKGRPQEPMRETPSSHMRRVVKMHPPLPPNSTHDMRVDQLNQRLKIALGHFQKESEVHVLVDVLEECCWSRNVRVDTTRKVVEVGQTDDGQT